jgi:hypothetical protein
MATGSLCIAGVAFGIAADIDLPYPAYYEAFRTTSPPRWTVSVAECSGRAGDPGTLYRSAEGLGRVWTTGEDVYRIDLDRGDDPDCGASFVQYDVAANRVRYRLEGRGREHRRWVWDLICEWVARTLLLRGLRDGVLLHAAGLELGGKSVGLLGQSGAGKSTLTSLFHRTLPCRVLNDDTVVLTWGDGRFMLWGTPWARFDHVAPSAAGNPIDRLLVIDHGVDNILRPLSGVPAVRSLLGQLQRIWPPTATAAVVDRLCELGARVPIDEFLFVPDERAVHLIAGKLGGRPGAT